MIPNLKMMLAAAGVFALMAAALFYYDARLASVKLERDAAVAEAAMRKDAAAVNRLLLSKVNEALAQLERDRKPLSTIRDNALRASAGKDGPIAPVLRDAIDALRAAGAGGLRDAKSGAPDAGDFEAAPKLR